MTYRENLKLLSSWGSYDLESETLSGEKVYRFRLMTSNGYFLSVVGSIPAACAEDMVKKVKENLWKRCNERQ